MASAALNYIDKESGQRVAPISAGDAFELLNQLSCVIYLLPAFQVKPPARHV